MEQRKKKELPEEMRMKIIDQHFKGKGYKSISKELGVPVTTVASIIRKVKEHGSVANLPGRGRKRKINPKVNRKIAQMMHKEPRKTSKDIKAELEAQGTFVSERTIRRALKESGHKKGRRPRRAELGKEEPQNAEPGAC